MIISINTTELKRVKIRLDEGKKTKRYSYAAYADGAFTKIEKLLAGRKPKAIGTVAGPGAFSATRTGVALANALAYGFNVPAISLTREQFDSSQPVTAGGKPPIVVVYGAPPNITVKKTK